MQGTGKPIVLLETNTASCNGFLGISDSFLATLWNLDLALSVSAHIQPLSSSSLHIDCPPAIAAVDSWHPPVSHT